MEKYKIFLVGAVATLPLLTACQPTQTATKNNSGSANTAVTTDSSPTDAATPATDNSSSPAKVGATGFTYQNGLSVAVLSVTKTTISDTAAGGQLGDALLKVRVRITNGTKAAFDTSMAQVHATAGADGGQLDTVFQDDIADFSGSIPPGRSKTALLGFAVKPADAGNVTIEVQPGFDYVSSFFDNH